MNQSLLCHKQRETFSLQKLLYGLSKPRGLLHCSSNYGNLPEGDQDTPAPPSSEPGMSEVQQLFYIILVILVVGTDFLKIYFLSPSVHPAVGFWEALAVSPPDAASGHAVLFPQRPLPNYSSRNHICLHWHGNKLK